jgi:HPt (histidine-containing phosphotransfer) domain-containing protein
MSDSIIDVKVFNEVRDLMGDALPEFIESYLGNSPGLLENIDTALQASDLQNVYLNAHQLKGGSGSIGAMQVYQLAMQLEQQARGGEADIATLQPIYQQLQRAYDSAAAELSAHLPAAAQ